MSCNVNLLDNVRIASPCMASWADMTGEERVRFCCQCNLNVYNLSEMTRADAEQLIIEKEGRLCGRMYTRADGTIITKDCPVGWRRFKRGLWRSIASAAAVFAFIATVFGTIGSPSRVKRVGRLRQVALFHQIGNWLDPPSTTRGKMIAVTPSSNANMTYVTMGTISTPVPKAVIPVGD